MTEPRDIQREDRERTQIAAPPGRRLGQPALDLILETGAIGEARKAVAHRFAAEAVMRLDLAGAVDQADQEMRPFHAAQVHARHGNVIATRLDRIVRSPGLDRLATVVAMGDGDQLGKQTQVEPVRIARRQFALHVRGIGRHQLQILARAHDDRSGNRQRIERGGHHRMRARTAERAGTIRNALAARFR